MVRSTTARTVALVARARATPGAFRRDTALPPGTGPLAFFLPALTWAGTTKVVANSTTPMATERRKIARVSGRMEAPPTRDIASGPRAWPRDAANVRYPNAESIRDEAALLATTA